MSKRILVQRKGKGSIFRARKSNVQVARYFSLDEKQLTGKRVGELVAFVHDPTNSSVLAKILFDDGSMGFTIAAEGTVVGQRVEFGKNAALEMGNVLTLESCVEGCPIFNIENSPGDGGSLVRAGGGYSMILSKDKGHVFVKLPAGKTTELHPHCRATIGLAAGGGRVEKPMVKAGPRYHLFHSKRKHYPIVRGVAMNPNSHPFGGSQHHPGKSKSTSRHAPAGRKVGAIASKRTGRHKKL
ncbi:MAG: 50S ribosomal protein L2 [archaeon]